MGGEGPEKEVVVEEEEEDPGLHLLAIGLHTTARLLPLLPATKNQTAVAVVAGQEEGQEEGQTRSWTPS